MLALKWVGGAIVVAVFAAVIFRYWREIASGIVVITLVALVIGMFAAMASPTLHQSDEQGPPGWWWSEQAEERREAEIAERQAAQAEMGAARAEQAAERAAWEEYRRNR